MIFGSELTKRQMKGTISSIFVYIYLFHLNGLWRGIAHVSLGSTLSNTEHTTLVFITTAVRESKCSEDASLKQFPFVTLPVHES